MSRVQVLQSAAFARAYKKLHAPQQADADSAVEAIVNDPGLGEAKKATCRVFLSTNTAASNN